MSVKADEVIRLRNEGMAYALKIAKDCGIDELQKQVETRGLLKISVKFTPEEIDRSIDNISDRVYNNMLTMVYAVLHDTYGYGKVRLSRFKQDFDSKVYLVGDTDPMGRHYARFEDFAEEANRLYGYGIDMDTIKETQRNNDSGSRNYVAIDEILKYLLERGQYDAVKELEKATSETERKKLSKKDRRKAECRMESDRHNKYYMDASEEENIEYWMNVFGLAMAERRKMHAEEICEVWKAADEINGQIADGSRTLDDIKDALLYKTEVMVDFTDGGENYGETA